MFLNYDPYTLWLLALDGGGMRGYFSLWILHLICQRAGIPPDMLFRVFDIMAGTSIGGISVSGLAIGKTPAFLINLLETKGHQIFDASAIPWIGKKKANYFDKLAFVSGVYESLYGNSILKSTITDVIGDKKMSDIEGCCVIIPSVKYNYKIMAGDCFTRGLESSVFFSNRFYDGLSGQDFFIKDVAMATSAAPMYFPSYDIGDDTYLDGGILQNNMANFAHSLASQIKPNATKIVILSIGTGLGNVGIARDKSKSDLVSKPTGASLLLDTLSLAISGPQETAHTILKNIANGSGVPIYMYRANKVLDPSVDTDLDSADDATLAYLRKEAQSVVDNDSDEINLFLQHFLL